MKYLVAFAFLATVTATGAYAMGSAPAPAPGSNQSQAAQPASFGDDSTLLRRPTPTPSSTQNTDPKNKKPVTASLGKDNTGKNSTSVFATTDPKIYCVWKDDTGSKGDQVRIVWYSEAAGGKSKKLSENLQTVPGAGSFGAVYIAGPSGGFPAGKYRADVYDGKKLAKSLPFTIQK